MAHREVNYSGELKPCPFCGSGARTYSLLMGHSWYVTCSNSIKGVKCGISTPYNHKSGKAAAKAWNHRAENNDEIKIRLGDAIDTNRKMITNIYEAISNLALDEFKKKLLQVAKKNSEVKT